MIRRHVAVVLFGLLGLCSSHEAAAQTPAAAAAKSEGGSALIATAGAELPEHDKGLTAAEFTPDGKLVVTVGYDMMLRVSDPETGTLKHEITLEGGDPKSYSKPPLAMAPKGTIAAVGIKNKILLYDVATGKLERRLERKNEEWFRDVRFTPGGDRIVATTYGEVFVYSLETGEIVSEFKTPQKFTHEFVLTPDGKQMICGGPTNTVSIHDLATGKLEKSLENVAYKFASHLALSPDGTLLAVADTDENISIHDLKRDIAWTPTIEKTDCSGLAFSSNGLLAVGWYGVSVFRLGDRKLEKIGTCEVRGPSASQLMTFSPDGSRILVADGSQHQVDHYRLERSFEEKTVATIDGRYMTGFVASRDGSLLAWSGRDVLKLYSVAEAKTVATAKFDVKFSDAHRLEFSPDGKQMLVTMYVGYNQTEARLYAVPSLELQHSWNAEQFKDEDAMFTPDGRNVLFLDTYESRLWDLTTGKFDEEKIAIKGERGRFLGGNKPTLVTAEDAELRVYDWSERKELRKWHAGGEVRSFAVSADGSRLVTYSYAKQASVWDVGTGDLVKELSVGDEGATAAAFSPDGRWLMMTGRDRLIKVWSCETWALRAVCPGDKAKLKALAFVGSGGRFLTAMETDDYGGGGFVRQWNLETMLERLPAPKVVAEVELPFTKGMYVHDFSDGDNDPSGYTAAGEVIYLYEGLKELIWFDAKTKVERGRLDIGDVSWVAFSPDGRKFAASYGDSLKAFQADNATKAFVKIWDTETRRLERTLTLQTSVAERLDFSPDGKTIAVAEGIVGFDHKGLVSLWDVASGERLPATIDDKSRTTLVCYSPDGTLLAFGGFENHLNVWDLKAGAMRFRKKLEYQMDDLQFSPDGKYVMTCGGEYGRGGIGIYDVVAGEPVAWCEKLKDETSSVALSPKGDLLAAACQNEKRESTYRSWSWPEGKELRRIEPESPRWGWGVVRFSPDGKELITNVFGSLKLWRLDHLFDMQLQRELQKLKDRQIDVDYVDDLVHIRFPFNAANDRALAELPLIKVPFSLGIIYSEGVTDAGLAPLAKQTQLTGLVIENCNKLTTASLTHLKALPLRSLEHENLELKADADVALLAEIGTLERLKITTPYSDESKLDLAPLAKLKRLRELRFNKFSAPSASLRHIAELSELEILQFRGSALRDDDFLVLGRLTKLRELIVEDDEAFTGAGLAALKDCRDLEVLNLEECEALTDDGIAAVRNFSKLRELNLSRTPVTDRGLEAVGGLTTLEQLGLPIATTDAGLAHLANLTRIRKLALYHEGITDRGLLYLSKWTEIETLELELKQIDGLGLAAFAGCPNLKRLYLSRLTGMTDEGLAGVGRLVQLEQLSLPEQTADAGLKHLSTLVSLKDLTLEKTKITAAGLVPLAQLPKLEQLSVAEVPLTDDAIPNLAALKQLSSLDIEKTKITPQGKDRLKGMFPKDRYLYISGP